MCGICCVLQIHHADHQAPSILLEKTKTYESLQRRGPNYCNSLHKALHRDEEHCYQVNGLFCGAVLHQRGKLTPQPLQDDAGNLLLWNGEIFAGIKVEEDENDGLVLLDLLKSSSTDADILGVLSKICGPWSVVYWQDTRKQLWFGRDVFGRRSLLLQWRQDSSNIGGTLTVSSVGCRSADTTGNWEEIPARGIYCIHCQRCSVDNLEIVLYPWKQESSVEPEDSKQASDIGSSGEMKRLAMQSEGLSSCDVIAGSPVTIMKSHLGISNPIMPLNKTIPKDKDSVLWQASMVGIRAHKTVTESMDTVVQQQDIPLNNSDKGSKVSEGLNLVKQGSDLVEQIEPRITDLFVKLEGQLQKHAHNLIDILGQAVNKRVHNLPRLKAMSGRDSDENRTKPDGDDVDMNEHGHICLDSCANSVDVDIKGDLTVMSRTDHDIATCCQSQKGNSLCDDLNPRGTAVKITSHPNLTVCAKEIGSTRQEQPREQLGKPQHDRCRVKQTGSGFGCHGDARVAILFSGGIDSMILAVLADRYVPEDEPIDLLNVAFQQVIKMNTSKNKAKNKHGQKTREDNQQKQPHFQSVKANTHTALRESVDALARGQRGTLLCSRYRFTYDVPDRITGRSGLEELRKINPHRRWNFVEINVTLDELRAMRLSRVSDLVYPLQSVLDDSIGCAIWFAARGQGNLIRSHPHETDDSASQESTNVESIEDSHVPYTSPAKVVLVGMGADEQLAGYSRHRGKFQSGGWEGLVAEMEMEVQRISSRNLGRDDRIISDHGRESRLPYLDEDVVNFLQQLPVWIKTDLTLPRGVGEKMLLRVAARQLGMTDSAILPKRAIQFGSRIAKMENSNEKASDVCGRLK